MAMKAVLAFGLQKSVGSLWKGDDFSDFTVVVEDTFFQCHRFILSACSGFFQGLFRSQMKECQENSVNIGGMTASTFNVIIHSLYTGVNGLTKENVLDVWSGAVQLQIGYLIAQCEKFVQKKISVHNCFKILQSASMFSAEKVVDHSIEFIFKHFEKIRNTESLLQLPYDYFYRVIESDYLRAETEDVVVETVIKWVEYKPSLMMCSQEGNKSAVTDCSKNNVETDDTRQNNVEMDDACKNNVETECTSQNIAETDETSRNYVRTVDDSTNNTKSDDIKRSSKESSGNFERKAGDNVGHNSDSDIDFAKESSSESMCTRGSQNENKDQETAPFVIENGQQEGLTEYEKNTLETKSMKADIGESNQMSENSDEFKRGDRKQHLFKLLSACRLFLISPTYLENIMRNCTLLLSCRESYNLVIDAVMYQWQVERRHDPWPEAAIHRWASSMKHVMVFLTGGKFLAYNLSSGSIKKLANIPNECCQSITVNVFDNMLCFEFTDTVGNIILSMYNQERCWHILTYTAEKHTALLTYGCHIYGSSNSLLVHMYCKYGHQPKWSGCCNLNEADALVRYKKYILAFCTKEDVVTAYCYNTETKGIHMSESMDGTSKGMASFSHLGDVYILQTNGSLWKIVSSDKKSVDFEIISKLWDQNYNLRGCVVYRKQLFVFCQKNQEMKTPTCLTSLPGIFKSIKIVEITSETPSLPMIVSESWLS